MVKGWSGSELVVRVVVEFRECELERRKKGKGKWGLTFSLTAKIFDPKIKTYQRTGVGMTFLRPLLIPMWNHLCSYPK